MSDRFDLEQQILDCWKVVDELKLINARQFESDISKDEMWELLQGLAAIYNLKFDQMFTTFEKCVDKKEI